MMPQSALRPFRWQARRRAFARLHGYGGTPQADKMGAMVLEGVPKVPLSEDHGIDRGTPNLRYTPADLELLLRRTWDGPFSVTWYGNLRACVAFLVSHVSEEIGSEELRFRDERFPLTVAARAEKQRRLT